MKQPHARVWFKRRFCKRTHVTLDPVGFTAKKIDFLWTVEYRSIFRALDRLIQQRGFFVNTNATIMSRDDIIFSSNNVFRFGNYMLGLSFFQTLPLYELFVLYMVIV